MVEIPLTGAYERYVLTVTLDGRDYRLTLAYNAFVSSWYLSVASSGGTPIRSGIRLVDGGVLVLPPSDPRSAPGAFVYIGQDAASQVTLGTASRLLYVSSDELDELSQGGSS